ncbi:MAG: RsmE family RNA methyltransferase, partial [Candidatus Omnitrophota bacterium]
KDALRLKPGKEVAVFDEKGNEYSCVIGAVGDKVSLTVKNQSPQARPDHCLRLTVAVAIPKRSKLDEIIDKLVQLGVERVIPLRTERVIVKLDKHKEALRLSRWKKIALVAAKQCNRNTLAVIDPVTSFEEMIARSTQFDLKLILHLEGERRGLKDVLDEKGTATFLKKVAVPFLVLIGPEGDFSAQEVSRAIAAGFMPVTLGDLVLRVDTAAIAVAAFIKLYACR